MPKIIDEEGTQISETYSTKDEKWVYSRLLIKLKKVIASIPFAHNLLAAYYCAFDPNLKNKTVKRTLIGALIYFLMPIDAIPDLVPFAGFLDDASVLAAVITIVGKHIDKKHHLQAEITIQKWSN